MNNISQQEGVGFSTERIRRIFRESWSFSCIIKDAYAKNFCQFIVDVRNKVYYSLVYWVLSWALKNSSA